MEAPSLPDAQLLADMATARVIEEIGQDFDLRSNLNALNPGGVVRVVSEVTVVQNL